MINKTDLAPHVGASLDVMQQDAATGRGERPFVFTSLKSGDGADQVADLLLRQGGVAPIAPA